MPDWLPGEWPFIFGIRIDNPKKPWWLPIAHDYYIADIAIEAPDGEWWLKSKRGWGRTASPLLLPAFLRLTKPSSW